MRRSRSTCPKSASGLVAAGLAAALWVGAPRRAEAQACCGGAAALTPGRLLVHEEALVGARAQVIDWVGSFDGNRRFVGSPERAGEVGLEQDLLGTARVTRRGQLSLVVPIVETFRQVPGLSEVGGGLGDVQVGGRYDFTLSDDARGLPGIALLAALTFPTGRAVEEAQQPLATDATGTGAFQGALGLTLERSFEPAFVAVSGTLAWSAPRAVGDHRTQRGLSLSAAAVVGASTDEGAALALTATYTAELPARLDGEAVPDSGQAVTRLGVAGGVPIGTSGLRLQGALFGDVPLTYLGRNHQVGIGGSITLLWGF